MTRRSALLLLAALFVLSALSVLPVRPALAEQPGKTPNIDASLQAYEKIKQVKPSRIGSEEFQRIIQDRAACYSKITAPLQRKRPCNIAYLDSIIHTARKHLKSVPQLGLFIRDVQYCPVAYSMCIGERMQQETCVTTERQCIDHSLDKYWRGAPPNGLQD